MSNAIDLFQPGCDVSAVGTLSASVYVDGQLCDFLVPISITLAGEPVFSEAVLKMLPRRPKTTLHCGQRIVLKSVYDSGTGKVLPDETDVFAGLIEQIEIGRESKVTAKDYSARLKRITVYGQFVNDGNGNKIFIDSADTIFNPGGKGNSARQGGLFAAGCDGIMFSCADAIYYLLKNYILDGELVLPTLEQLKVLTEERSISDIDVTGLNLTAALSRCCRQAGLSFRFEPSMCEQLPAETIVFYKPGQGREIELNMQYDGEQLDISKTNIAEFQRKKFSSATNRYIVQGDYKIFEATFELVKGWNPALESNDYDRYSPVTNDNFNQVRDVWRKWVLNEAGDYSGEPYNQGSAFDFMKIFEGGKYLRTRRRFLPCLSCGNDGGSFGYYLEMSYTNGSYWWPYMSSFKVLLDQCGIWLSVEQFDSDMWFAILKGMLKVRITASVMADERIAYTVCDGAINSIREVADNVITLPRRFKYQKVSPWSVLKGNPSNEIDDTMAMAEFANNLCCSSSAVSEDLQIKTMTLNPYFRPGDRIVSSPDCSDVLDVLYDSRNICTIEKVYADYARQQTIITAVKKRK